MYNDQSQTYSQFKDSFYRRFPDLSVFDLDKNINLTKVVLGGLRVNFVARGKVTPFSLFHPIKREAYRRLKARRSKRFKISSFSQKFLIVGSDRFIQDEDFRVEQYSGNVQKKLGRKNCFVLSNAKDFSNEVDVDASFNHLKANFIFDSLTPSEKAFLKKLRRLNNRLKKIDGLSGDEKMNIEIAFHFFFIEFCVTSRFIQSNKNLEECYLICHYHNEGRILALRENGIPVIELQHGLISKVDIFYCFPDHIKNFREKMLFPDRIWVWGEYWQEVLKSGFEFLENQVVNKGYFPVLESSKENELVKSFLGDYESKVIVCTQVSLHNYFIEYVKWLSEQKQSIGVVVKTHPSEDLAVYSDLDGLENVLLTKDNIYGIFPLVDIHISIYSTTLIESMKFGVKNYSLDVEVCKDYVDEYVSEGISDRITVGELPSKEDGTDSRFDRFFGVYE